MCEKSAFSRVALGYKVERADEDKSPGIVTDRIVQKIIDSALVLADLHGHNPNVMYEVAIRHATNKPLVQMIEYRESLPFDIGGLNTIFYDPTVLGLENWRRDLKTAIVSIKEGHVGENPVARAGLFRNLDSQRPSEGRLVEALLSAIQNLRQDVSNSNSAAPRLSFDHNRIILLPHQLVEHHLKEMLATTPGFANRRFLLVPAPDEITLTELPQDMNGEGKSWQYTFSGDQPISEEIKKLKVAVKRDLTSGEGAPSIAVRPTKDGVIKAADR